MLLEQKKNYYEKRLNEIEKQERNLTNDQFFSYISKIDELRKVSRPDTQIFDEDLHDKNKMRVNLVDTVKDLSELYLIDPLNSQESIKKAFLQLKKE